jgi:2-polyprenyl-3-methyl-5-hydroxy-6-metoxy-1,4-benzoquinol methylase
VKKLTTENMWEGGWSADGRDQEISSIFGLDQLVKQYLPITPPQGAAISFVELGCAPGSNMVYFHRELGYEVTGVDYAGIELTDNYLAEQGIPYHLVDQDVFEWCTDVKYDVVFSTGLIEHFDPLDPIIDVHKRLVSENGFIVIAIPNLRYFNKLMARIVSPAALKTHNMKIMSPKVLGKYFAENVGFICRYCNYYKTSLLDLNSNYDYLKNHKNLKRVYNGLRKLSKRFKLSDIPNRFFSPNIVIIAQRASYVKDVPK